MLKDNALPDSGDSGDSGDSEDSEFALESELVVELVLLEALSLPPQAANIATNKDKTTSSREFFLSTDFIDDHSNSFNYLDYLILLILLKNRDSMNNKCSQRTKKMHGQ
ncbi:hypothetical protein PCURB6_16670 [Paenibacillus curdlanolyticus]|nr:hypothetical protein PCURB6_16670 [Paenibacillus curdlanolyticus]